MSIEIVEEKVLFIDIETVSQYPNYGQMPENWQRLWDKKAENIKRDENDTADTLYQRAGIYAEFGKIICVCAGFFHHGEFRVKSYSNAEEKDLLSDFAGLLNDFYKRHFNTLCAHNGKEFDYPYLIRRMLVNGVYIPDILNITGKKPWEVPHLDTMELWKFGDFKNYTSLELLAALFDIPSPKDDISGSDIHKVYWTEGNLARIEKYCRKDVVTIAQIIRRFQGKPLIDEDQIVYV